MKKIVLVVAVLLIIMLNSYSKQEEFSLSNYFKVGDITKYTAEDVYSLYGKSSAKSSNLAGESITFEGNMLDECLNKLQAKVKFTEYIQEQDLTLVYCYSSLIPNSVNLKNNDISLQIAVCEEYTVVGWPMIIGSF